MNTKRSEGPAREKTRGRCRQPMPRWFRRWIWLWAFFMSCAALLGYCMSVWRGVWTPDHLLRLLTGGVW